MQKPFQPILLSVLIDPAICTQFNEVSWGELLRQARTANVLGRTLQCIEQNYSSGNWPVRIQQAYQAEKNIAQHRAASLLWELEGIANLLKPLAIRPVLLKGAAYLAGEFWFARYRAFGDIDLIVPRSRITYVEKQFMINGWASTKHDEYDQAYYRKWMHELPPMQHMHRGTNIDIHHGILPLTAKYQPDSQMLFSAAKALPSLPSVDVLAPVDMFLHAATHLFCEGEDDKAFRNLLDLHDLLLYQFNGGQVSGDALINRAVQMDLIVPLALAVRYLERVFSLQEASTITGQLRAMNRLPKWPGIWDLVFDSIFSGFHSEQSRVRLMIARQILFLRGHYLRMPLRLLVPHLIRKFFHKKQIDPI